MESPVVSSVPQELSTRSPQGKQSINSKTAPDPKLLHSIAVLEKLVEKRLSPGETLPVRFEPKEKCLLRFLKSCQGDIEEAANVIADHVRWRKENNVDEIAGKSLEELLGEDVRPTELVNCMPILERGEDLEKRPVLYMIASKLDARAAHKLVTPERVLQYQIWLRERALARLDLYGKGAWRNPPYYTLVADLRGVRLNQATGEFYSLMKRIMDLDQYHYPGRVGMLIIVNVPFFFQMIWGALKGWLGSTTEKKITICYREAEAKRVLLSMIPQSRLPHDLGGAAFSLPSVRTASADDFYCSSVHFSKLSSIASAPSIPNAAAIRRMNVLVTKEEDEDSQRAVRGPREQSSGGGTMPGKEEDDEVAGQVLQQQHTKVSFNEILRESMARATKNRQELTFAESGEEGGGKSASRRELTEKFTRRLNQNDNLEALRSELAEAVSRTEQDIAQFERDVLTLRARLRRRLFRLRTNVGDATVFVSAESSITLRQMLSIVEEERDAHARAVAFAKNYIDVEAQEWTQTQRSLRARLDRVHDENRGLVRTVEVALGEEALEATLQRIRGNRASS